METNLSILRPENIRLISFSESTITVLLKDDTEVSLKFKDREQMGKGLADWARKPEVEKGSSWPLVLEANFSLTRNHIEKPPDGVNSPVSKSCLM